MSEAIDTITGVEPNSADHAFIVAASWEERCLFAASRCHGDYRAQRVLMTVYDGKNAKREENIRKLEPLLAHIGEVCALPASHDDPLANVHATVDAVRAVAGKEPRLTIDTSTFTRKHLLQLLYGLDAHGLLGNTNLIYAQPSDYHTGDNEPSSKGVASVRAVEGFTGANWPSRDSLLVLFLSYEGRRAYALWEHLEPNQALLVIPDPPYKEAWRGRTEEQNRYLLSLVPEDRVIRASAVDCHETEELLTRLAATEQWGLPRFNYQVAPLGTKAQLIGTYKFWRARRGDLTIMYANPNKYRSERPQFPCEALFLLDRTREWPSLQDAPS